MRYGIVDFPELSYSHETDTLHRSQTGQNPRDLIDRLKVEIRLFSTYILLSAL